MQDRNKMMSGAFDPFGGMMKYEDDHYWNDVPIKKIKISPEEKEEKRKKEAKRFDKFINEFIPGDLIRTNKWNRETSRDYIYLGYTFNRKLLVISIGRVWYPTHVNMVDASNFYIYDRLGPTKDDMLKSCKTPEEIEFLLQKYCGQLRRKTHKNFITILSNKNNGIIIG